MANNNRVVSRTTLRRQWISAGEILNYSKFIAFSFAFILVAIPTLTTTLICVTEAGGLLPANDTQLCRQKNVYYPLVTSSSSPDSKLQFLTFQPVRILGYHAWIIVAGLVLGALVENLVARCLLESKTPRHANLYYNHLRRRIYNLTATFIMLGFLSLAVGHGFYWGDRVILNLLTGQKFVDFYFFTYETIPIELIFPQRALCAATTTATCEIPINHDLPHVLLVVYFYLWVVFYVNLSDVLSWMSAAFPSERRRFIEHLSKTTGVEIVYQPMSLNELYDLKAAKFAYGNHTAAWNYAFQTGQGIFDVDEMSAV